MTTSVMGRALRGGSLRRGRGSVRRLTRAIAGLGLAWGVAACDQLGSVARPEVPLWVHHPGSALNVEARRDLSVKKLDAGEPYERGVPTLDPAHRRLFVGSSDHGLYALSTVTLASHWRFETGGAVQGEPLYDQGEDAVYFGSNDGALYKLRAADGKLLWRFATNGEILRKPVLAGKTLYALNANDTLVAVHKDTGKLRWYRQRTSAFGMEIAGYAGPTCHDGLVYAAFSDGVVLAYRAQDGSEAWSAPVDLTADAEQASAKGELRYLDIDTTPVLAPITTENGQDLGLFVASYEGGVYALDPKSGGQLWRNEKATGVTELVAWTGPRKPRDATTREPLTTRTILVASSGLTGLWGLGPDEGDVLWRKELPAGGLTPVAPWSGALLVGTSRYGLFLVHPLDGSILDGIAAGGSYAAAPATHGRRAFAMSNDGVLTALSLEPPRR